MIRVGVGADDPADAIAGGVQYRVDVLRDGRARVQHRYLVIAQQVGIGTGAGHYAGVGGDQPPHGEEKVYLVLEGRGRFRMGDEEFALEPGQLFTVPARVEHGFHSITDDLLLLAFFAPPEGTVAQAPA